MTPAGEVPTVICLMPVRNESWIIERSLAAAAMWADLIIVADQGSADGTRDLVAQQPKARLVDNNSPEYDEGHRQRLLLATARETPGRRVLVALDADESLSANILTSSWWAQFLAAPEGSFARIPWVNIRPGHNSGWTPGDGLIMALIDDGADHVGESIHSTRLPVSDESLEVRGTDVRALHYQYVDPARTASKHRWYQCWERVHAPERPPRAVYRQYHHMDAVPPEQEVALQEEWFRAYEERGLPMRRPPGQPVGYWWDEEVLQWVRSLGAEHFRRVDIWDDQEVWDPSCSIPDPRSRVDRVALWFLRRTQSDPHRLPVRLIQRALALASW